MKQLEHYLLAEQVEIEATMAVPVGNEIHHEVTTRYRDGWQEFSVYIRLPTGARWLADCGTHAVAQVLAKALSLHYKIPIVDKVAEYEQSTQTGGD